MRNKVRCVRPFAHASSIFHFVNGPVNVGPPLVHIRSYFCIIFASKILRASRMAFLHSLPNTRYRFESLEATFPLVLLHSLRPSSSHSSVLIFRRVIFTDFPLTIGRFLSIEHTRHVQTPIHSFTSKSEYHIDALGVTELK